MNVAIPMPGLPPETPPATRITLENFQKNIRILLLNQETLKQRRSKDKKNMEALKQLIDTKNLLLRITAAQRQLCSNLTFYLLENFPQKYPTQKSIFEEKKQENISIKSSDVPVDDTDRKEKKRKKKRKTPTPDESEEEDELDEKFLLYMSKDGPFSPTYKGHIEKYQSYYPIAKEKENDDYNKIAFSKTEKSTIGSINIDSFMLHYGLLTLNQSKTVTSFLEENTRKKARKRTITSLPVYSNKKFRYKSYLPVNVFDPPQLQPRKTRQSTASARASPSRQTNRASPSRQVTRASPSRQVTRASPSRHSMVSARESPSRQANRPSPSGQLIVSARASPFEQLNVSNRESPSGHSTLSSSVSSEQLTSSTQNLQTELKEDHIDDLDLKEEHKEVQNTDLGKEQLEDSVINEGMLTSDDSNGEELEEEIPHPTPITIMERKSKRQEERGNIKREIQKGTWEKYKKREGKSIKKKKMKPQSSEDFVYY